MKVHTYLKRCQKMVEATLKQKLPLIKTEPHLLHKAMRYSVLNGGKRLRPSLIYATGEALGAQLSVLSDIGAAVELVHAYSLIHDDLPALDNDDLRRGKPTCHKMFGVATAILAGDALQSLAFEILADIPSGDVPAERKVEMIRMLAGSIGSRGMIGGEELDIEMVNQTVSLKKIEKMYQLKTGALISASILLGALAANCEEKKVLDNLALFSKSIGLAFQIHDDIIGIESDTTTLGKTQGADQALNKPVYPELTGIARAKQREQAAFRKAIGYLDRAGIEANMLKELAAYVIQRNY